MTEVGAVFACALTGVFAGLLYELNRIFRYFVKNRAATMIADVLFFAVFGIIMVGASALFRLPDFRLYMYISAVVGFFLYGETLHRILAFFAKKLYNKLRSSCAPLYARLKEIRERRKVQKNRNRSDRRRRRAVRVSARVLDLPNDFDLSQKSQDRRAERGNRPLRTDHRNVRERS